MNLGEQGFVLIGELSILEFCDPYTTIKLGSLEIKEIDVLNLLKEDFLSKEVYIEQLINNDFNEELKKLKKAALEVLADVEINIIKGELQDFEFED
jgi:hypothetical protein